MRISDWSSDVCSSDLPIVDLHPADRDVDAADVGLRELDVGDDARLFVKRDVGIDDRRPDIEPGRAGQADVVGADIDRRGLIGAIGAQADQRSEEHTSELQSLMRISYAVFCLKKKK